MARLATMAAALFGVSAAQAAPLIGPWPIDHPTEVMVLGTPHLSAVEAIQREWLSPVLDRLADWRPGLIAIEGLSGPECLLLRTYEASWPDTANDYCKRIEAMAALGAKATGLAQPAAEAAAEKAVATLGPNSSPAERRRQATLFAAAGNLGSAATQWLRLPPEERRPDALVTPDLAQALDELAMRKNENFWIGAALAARLGLERIYPTDDHISDRIQAEAPPGLEEAMRAVWSGERPPEARQAEAMEKGLSDGASVLALYRYHNKPEVGEAFVRGDMGKAFVTPSSGRHGRRYVAWWEARNLRQVANIRAALGTTPGVRALVIVGSTHKPYFDAYLRMMHEVRVVQAREVLGK